eukprot:XP_001700562.1 nuclear pre-mRNA splicing factor, component of splicing factor 3b [Chlamydomonas reinhardtii]
MADDEQRAKGVPLTGVVYDQDLYGGGDRAGYRSELVEEEEDDQDYGGRNRGLGSAAAAARSTIPDEPAEDGPGGLGFEQPKSIYEREDDYRRRRLNRIISPDRNDAFAMGDKTPDARVRTYADIMREQQLQRELDNTMAQRSQSQPHVSPAMHVAKKARSEWDTDGVEATPGLGNRWDATPGAGLTEATPGANRWDATPGPSETPAGSWGGETPAGAGAGTTKRSRWDQTPALGGGATPAVGVGVTPSFFSAATPAQYQEMRLQREMWERNRPLSDEELDAMLPGEKDGYKILAPPAGYKPVVDPARKLMATPTPLVGGTPLYAMPEVLAAFLKAIGHIIPLMDAEHAFYYTREVMVVLRREFATPDEEMKKIVLKVVKQCVGTEGVEPDYIRAEILPDFFKAFWNRRMALDRRNYKALDNPALKADLPIAPEGLPEMKPEDMQFFSKLLQDVDEAELSAEEAKERKIMKLLLKVKNGTPPQRKSALRTLTDKSRELGAGPLFNAILPLLMQPTLEDQERHLLVKILVVIEPLLIDEDYYARVEGREIIANLSKAAGLAQMIAAMRPDIDNIDEYVRNTTARAFSVVASALGIPALLPFLKAVCLSKKSWQARHTGIKIVQQIAILMGCAVLPHLRSMVDIVKHGLKVGCSDIVSRVVEDLKDESEPYRRMVMETIDKVITELGAADVDARLEELLIDGILYAFQEQVADDSPVMLNGFGTTVNGLGKRARPYLPQICGTIKWRLNNKSAKIRQQAADLIARIAPVMKACDEEGLLGHLGVVLYEYLGEEYPEVQENVIDLVGRIADRGHEYVPAREWMRICFELLDMLKAHKKAIRRATDVLVTLLNNLKVQERQNRVCTTVAIAIVAESCQPFTVLPALMNEYRTPELNALSFMFEYIGEMGKDYIHAVTPLLEDALMDRDLVHRQTAASVVGHMALGVAGLGCEGALTHLLNYVWPNIFEVSPHVAVGFAVDGCRVSLGPCLVLSYVLQGLWHPARKVRQVYWKLYNNLYIGAQDALVACYPAMPGQHVATPPPCARRQLSKGALQPQQWQQAGRAVMHTPQMHLVMAADMAALVALDSVLP